MKQLTGQDAIFLHVESAKVKTHFTLLTIYDQSQRTEGPLRYREIVRYFDDHLSGIPTFRRKLYPVPFQLDAPYWMDDPDYNIESHIRHVALPEPRDWRQFCIFVAQVQAMPMDLSKPLWDMMVVEGLDRLEGVPPGSFAILTRMHHSIADGATARGLMAALHQPAGVKPELPPKHFPESPPTLPGMAARAVINNARQVMQVQSRLLRQLPNLRGAIKPAIDIALERLSPRGGEEAGDAGVPVSPFNGDMDYRRAFQMRVFPLADIRQMRGAVPGATVNDVVLTLIGGAVRRYFSARRKVLGKDLYAICPVNLRADKTGTDSLAGNDISMMRACLFTETRDPLERLARIRETTQASKSVQSAPTARELVALSKEAPNLLLAVSSRVASNLAIGYMRKRPLSNMVITNVPGPQEPMYFMGARVVLSTGAGPVSPASGVIFPVTSYDGKLVISFTGCSGWIDDPQALADCLEQSFLEMRQKLPAAAARALQRAKAKPPRRRPARKARKTG